MEKSTKPNFFVVEDLTKSIRNEDIIEIEIEIETTTTTILIQISI